jgi:cell division protein FtsB
MASSGAALIKRIVVIGIAVGAVAFAVEGGEFGSTDLVRQSREKVRIGRSIDSLQRVVDSLRRYETAVLKDPATQERLAREVFGMVRGDKELLYRFADSAAGGKRP